jgi:hypothetical protein
MPLPLQQPRAPQAGDPGSHDRNSHVLLPFFAVLAECGPDIRRGLASGTCLRRATGAARAPLICAYAERLCMDSKFSEATE